MDLVIDAGELIAPREVYDELHEGQDDLLEFVKARQSKLFKDLDEEQIRLMFEIKARFPKLSDDKKVIPDADPFVIALARQKGWKVVTSESDRSSVRIPAACKHYGIPYLSPADFIAEKNWVI
jgi:beta-phosphoglucomutase-like phosphatase (HAD superfamily)